MKLLTRNNAPAALVYDNHRPGPGETLVPAIDGQALDAYTPEQIAALLAGEAPPPPWWYVSKLDIVDRLEAIKVMRGDGTEVTGRQAVKDILAQDDYARDRWEAATQVRSDDPQVRDVLAAAGADPDAVLARA